MNSFPEFSHPLVEVPGAQALQEWRRYQELWRKEGCSALLVGDAEEVCRLHESTEFNEGTAVELLAAAGGLTAEQFFARKAEENEEFEIEAEDGEWPAPGTVAPMELDAHLHIRSREPKEKVYLARIPTTKPYEIPAYLKWGAWNECPAPEEHTAVLRHWHEKYGIEIYAITGDVMECAVARPPADRDGAIALARQQFLYCGDIVDQGVETIFALASTLQNAHAWYFWWD